MPKTKKRVGEVRFFCLSTLPNLGGFKNLQGFETGKRAEKNGIKKQKCGLVWPANLFSIFAEILNFKIFQPLLSQKIESINKKASRKTRFLFLSYSKILESILEFDVPYSVNI
jgi:hypothetical protein